MNSTIIHDSLKVAEDLISKSTGTNDSTNWWMWLAILEFGIIGILFFREKFRISGSYKKRFKNDSLKQEVDFDNIINSSFNSIRLYDELKVKCHPDLFPTDKAKNAIAEEIFQEITKNKNNIKRLLELKEDAIQKLNINF